MASAGQFSEAVIALNRCLDASDLTASVKRRSYDARAWAHSNQANPQAAIADLEAAFQISPAAEHREFINYASYLRAAGRFQDSLAPLKSAEALDRNAGQLSMMTQYNLGWTLQELGRHEDAVAAFSKGIPVQPDYAFVYYRRGVSLEALGKKDLARADFEKVSQLIKTLDAEKVAGRVLPKLRQKLEEYGLK